MNSEELGQLLRDGVIDYQRWSDLREMINEEPHSNSGMERTRNDFDQLLRDGNIDYQRWSNLREMMDD